MAKDYSDGIVGMFGDLRFNPDRERHIIDTIRNLKSTGKFNIFIETMLRVVLSNPEIVINSDEDLYKLIKLSGPLKIDVYNTENKKEIADMHRKVDHMFDLVLSMYTLVMFNKQIGIEDNTKNMAVAQFMVERQLKELTRALGVEDLKTYESDKDTVIKEKAEQALEYIVNNYDGVVQGIKSMGQPIMVQSTSERQYTQFKPTVIDNTDENSSNTVDDDTEIDIEPENRLSILDTIDMDDLDF